MFFSFAPPGGGYLVLHPLQFADKELRALIAKVYPETKVIESKPLGKGSLDKN